jgi:hypothetical protein
MDIASINSNANHSEIPNSSQFQYYLTVDEELEKRISEASLAHIRNGRPGSWPLENVSFDDVNKIMLHLIFTRAALEKKENDKQQLKESLSPY